MAVQFTVMSIDDDQVSPPRKSIFLKEKISIGRSRLNDLVLEHPGVSNTHALVRVEGTNGSLKFYISDLDSTNGTMVGNRRLDPRVETHIPDRDRVMIAGYILKMETVNDTDVSSGARSGEQHIYPSVEAATEGKATTTFKVPDVAVAAGSESGRGESSKTVWNSSLLGAFRGNEKRKDKPASAVAEASPVEKQMKSSVSTNVVPTNVAKVNLKEVPNDLPEQEEIDDKPTEIPSFGAEMKLLLDRNTELDFIATKLLSITGKVLHKGAPLAGVQVRDANLGETVTDNSGQFYFRDIVEGTAYNITIEKPGFLIATNTLLNGSLHDNDVFFDVVARQLFSISGRITHRGKALEGATVEGGKLGVVKTDSSGVYRFHNVPEGEEYTLKASKDGFIFGTVRKVS